MFLVLELAKGGELYKYVKRQPGGVLSEAKASRYSQQIASALLKCHQHNIIHRDLKLENVLLGKKDQVKLADFGWCIHSKDGFKDKVSRQHQFSLVLSHKCTHRHCEGKHCAGP